MQGWKQHDMKGFFGLVGPLYTRQEEAGWAYAFQAEARHTNSAGMIHGGMLATLLDQALSAIAWEASGRSPCVTVQLNTQFMAPAHAGDFITARGHILRQTASLIFVQGEITVQDQLCVAGHALMKVLKKRESAPEKTG